MNKFLEMLTIALLCTGLPGLFVVCVGIIAAKKKWSLRLFIPLSVSLSLVVVLVILWLLIKGDWWILAGGLLLCLMLGITYYARWEQMIPKISNKH